MDLSRKHERSMKVSEEETKKTEDAKQLKGYMQQSESSRPSNTSEDQVRKLRRNISSDQG